MSKRGFGKITIYVFILSILPSAILRAEDSEISKKLDRLAKSLVSVYEAKAPDERHTAIAILPFYTNDALAKQRTGHALAELLAHSIRAYPDFTVVERVELNKILDELRLNASGIADPEDALKIGKLTGAKLQIFGSMEKIGAKYHINARIVETETGNVIATAYETLPPEFLEEAGLLPVSKKRALELYFLYNMKNVSILSGPYYGHYGTEITFPRALAIKQLGGGFRYDLTKRIQADAAVMYAQKGKSIPAYTYPVTMTSRIAKSIAIVGYRFLVNYTTPLSSKFKLYCGGGWVAWHISQEVTDDHTSPVLHTRIEFKLRPRLVLGIGANYEFNTPNWRAAYYYDPPGPDTNKPSRFSLEPSIGYYF